MKHFTLSNGHRIPALGVGFWKVSDDDVELVIKKSIEEGYRHIDGAAVYGNEVAIGKALAGVFAAGQVKREELFITSKLWNSNHEPEKVLPAVKKTLEDLQLDYLDLYLIHWPVCLSSDADFPAKASQMIPVEEIPLTKTWAAMEQLVQMGLVKSIGVSNFNIRNLRVIKDNPATTIQPVVNQIERHPYLQQNNLLKYCSENGVHVTAYSTLGSQDRPARLKCESEPIILEDPHIVDIAKRHGVKAAQILLGWGVRCGTSVLAKSSNAVRLGENLASVHDKSGAADMEGGTMTLLDEDDLAKIAALDKHRRYVTGEFWCPEGGPYTLDFLWGGDEDK